MGVKTKAKNQHEKLTTSFLKTWLQCPRDKDGERDVNDGFVDKALSLMEKGRLQTTVNELIQTGRLQDFNDGVDLNFQTQCLSALITADKEGHPDDPFAQYDEFHLIAIPWSGDVEGFQRFETATFQNKLLKILEHHFEKLFQPHALNSSFSFSIRLPSELAHPAVFASLPSDQKNLILQHLFDYNDDEGFQTLSQLHEQMIGESEIPDHAHQTVIAERLILLGMAFRRKDFAPEFNFNRVLMQQSIKHPHWNGASLSPTQTQLFPPMPLNGALIQTLSSHLKNHFWIEIQSEENEGVMLEGLNIAYDPNFNSMNISALSNQEVFSEVQVPMEWFFSCGLSSSQVLQTLLNQEEAPFLSEASPEEMDEDQTLDSFNDDAENVNTSSSHLHPSKPTESITDDFKPSFIYAPGSKRIH